MCYVSQFTERYVPMPVALGETAAATADEAFNFANRLGAFWRDAEVVSAEASTVRRCRLNTSG